MGGEKRVGKGSADIIMLIKLMKEKNSVLRKEIGWMILNKKRDWSLDLESLI